MKARLTISWASEIHLQTSIAVLHLTIREWMVCHREEHLCIKDVEKIRPHVVLIAIKDDRELHGMELPNIVKEDLGNFVRLEWMM